jgi:hypothetical protein
MHVLLPFSGESEHALTLQISSQHPNEKPPKRNDGYWRAYITRAGESTAMQVDLLHYNSDSELWINRTHWPLSLRFVSCSNRMAAIGKESHQ